MLTCKSVVQLCKRKQFSASYTKKSFLLNKHTKLIGTGQSLIKPAKNSRDNLALSSDLVLIMGKHKKFFGLAKRFSELITRWYKVELQEKERVWKVWQKKNKVEPWDPLYRAGNGQWFLHSASLPSSTLSFDVTQDRKLCVLVTFAVSHEHKSQ